MYASNAVPDEDGVMKPRMRPLAKNSFAIMISDYNNFMNGEWVCVRACV